MDGSRSVSWRGGIATLCVSLLVFCSCNGSGGSRNPRIFPLEVTTQSLPDGMEGVAYSEVIRATGGVRPYSWSLTSGPPPSGMDLGSDGVFSGTPPAPGTFSLDVAVQDKQNPPEVATASFTWVVKRDPSKNTPPGLTLLGVAPFQRGLVDLHYRLDDADSDLLTVSFDYSTDSGATYAAATQGPGGTGPGPFQGTPTPEDYLFVWDSLADVGGLQAAVRCRVRVSDGLVDVEDVQDFTVDNRPGQGIFVPSADMVAERMDHTMTLLDDGTVLVAGGTGINGSPLDTAEIFSPTTGRFEQLGATMTTPRSGHTATLLADGTVLLVGGFAWTPGGERSSTEIYDPAAQTFQASAGMSEPRTWHAASVTPGGAVITGGVHGPGSIFLQHAEVFDPTAGSFGPPATLDQDRYGHSATPLPSGRVLLVGGSGGQNPTCEEFDPVAGSSQATAGLPDPWLEFNLHRATALENGSVLITGGGPSRNVISFATSFSDAFLYEPGVGLTHVGNMQVMRRLHIATRLKDGRVLIAGGEVSVTPFVLTNEAEVFDPIASSLTATGPMTIDRKRHAAVRLDDGRVLVTGGMWMSGDPLRQTERYHP